MKTISLSLSLFALLSRTHGGMIRTARSFDGKKSNKIGLRRKIMQENQIINTAVIGFNGRRNVKNMLHVVGRVPGGFQLHSDCEHVMFPVGRAVSNSNQFHGLHVIGIGATTTNT